MSPKPAYLSGEHAMAWDDPEVAGLYHHRPEYPPALFDLLDELLGSGPRVVLDLGAGTGVIARHLARRVQRIDAIDPALPMIEAGKQLPGGDDPRIRWVQAAAETGPLDGPYGLAVTSQSLHWMEWDVVLPRLAGALAPAAYLAIVDDPEEPEPWHDALHGIIARYSAIRNYQNQFELIPELERLGLFVTAGQLDVPPMTIRQPLESYVASFHARSSLTRGRMGSDAAARFDDEIRALVGGREIVERGIGGRIVYGRPVARA